MKDLVQKFKILAFIDHLSCLFNYILACIHVDDGNNNNDDGDNNNNNNNNNRAYPSRHSGQPALALIGWIEWAVTLCGGTKSQK